jgi:competence ComEA-like helix-hairpin-helix protein
LSLIAQQARAAPYAAEIDIDDEADLHQLYLDGEIDADTRDRLITLLSSKVDLNLATRDELYELPGVTYALADAVLAHRAKLGRFASVDELLEVAGMTEAVFDQLRPFVLVEGEKERERTYEAEIRMGGIGRTHSDDPAAYLRGKVRFLTHGGAGLLVAARPMIGTVNDAVSGWMCKTSECFQGQALSAAPEALRFDPAAVYAYWDGPRLAVIGGSYRVGYGLGLTLDNSTRRLPHGWYPNIEIQQDNEEGKIRPLDGFMGVAARYKELTAGPGWLDVSVFGSWWYRDLYVAELHYDRCVDADCKDTVPSLVDETPTFNPAESRDEYRTLYCDYPTLPWIMREALGGGNATYWLNRRSFVGLTGYAGNWAMTAQAKDIRPAAASKYPNDRTTWGAVGASTRFGLGAHDVGGEVTVTDRGAPAVLVQAWLQPTSQLEITPSFRFYSPDFDNPYARGESSPDEYLGNRTRDELGGRLQVDYHPLRWLRLMVDVDVWRHEYPGLRYDPTVTDPEDPNFWDPEKNIDVAREPAVDLETQFRIQLSPTSKERITLWVDYDDKDLSRGGRGLSYEHYESATLGDLSGGSHVSWAVNATTRRIPRVVVSATFKQTFEDVAQIATVYDHSWYAWLRVSTDLKPGPRLAARVMYFDESTTTDPDRHPSQRCDLWDPTQITSDWPPDLPGGCRGETYLDAYFEATQRLWISPLAGSFARVRAGWTHWTDHRLKWAAGLPCDDVPARDEVLVQGTLVVKF